MLLTIGGWAYVAYTFWARQEQELVALETYDLATLSGQKDFSKAVRDQYFPLPVWMFGVFTLFVFTYVYSFYRITFGRVQVPRSIASNLYEAVESGSMELPEGHPQAN
jgi:hypothetical protein